MTVIDPQRKCPICHQQCGTIFIPKECSCLKMCGNCLDDFYDSRHMSTKKKGDELFKCTTCGKKIFEVEIL
jgi:hypothetical protein